MILVVCGCHSRETKFVEQVKSSIDPKTLQEWAISQAKDHKSGYEIPDKDWPKCLLTKDGPSSAWVAGDVGKTDRYVIVAWGGGFGHWGLFVGNTNFVLTEQELHRPVVQWIPGVFIDPRGK